MERRAVRAFTLLEVLIATAILALGLGAVLRLMTIAKSNSIAASELASVQMACQTTLAERLSQNVKLRSEPSRPIPEARGWTLAVQIVPAPHAKLAVMSLIARKYAGPQESGPVIAQFDLVRWIELSRVDSSSMANTSTAIVNDPYALPTLPEGDPFAHMLE